MDLSKGDVSASAAARTETMGTNHGSLGPSNLVLNNSTVQVYSPQYFSQDRIAPTDRMAPTDRIAPIGRLKYEYPSFLYLMNMMDDEEDSNMSISVEPENLSRDSEALMAQEPNPLNSQSANYTDLQVIQPSLIFNSGGENEEEDDYTRLENIICALLSTPKSARIKLKAVAENITSAYKLYDSHPEGFFETVGDVQRIFLVGTRRCSNKISLSSSGSRNSGYG